MAGPITRGTAHIYGVKTGNITNATVVDFKVKKEHQNKDTTVNEDGNEIERRYDDLAQEASITLKIRTGYTVPDAASTLTYNTVVWDVVSTEEAHQAKGFEIVTLNLKKTEYVT